MKNNPYLEEFQKIPSTEYDLYKGDMEAYLKAILESRRSRNKYVFKYAYSVPTLEALLAIERLTDRIFEAGAGSGYWAHLLEKRGCDIYACDRAPWKNSWTIVHQEDAIEAIRKGKADGRALQLSWPARRSQFALRCLEAYRGNKLIYIGEWYGGCCATDDFFLLLAREWKELAKVNLPQYPNCHDGLWIMERTSLLHV